MLLESSVFFFIIYPRPPLRHSLLDCNISSINLEIPLVTRVGIVISKSGYYWDIREYIFYFFSHLYNRLLRLLSRAGRIVMRGIITCPNNKVWFEFISCKFKSCFDCDHRRITVQASLNSKGTSND